MSIRTTSSREKVLQILEQLQQEISAQELYLELRNQQKSIGLATVYRVLKSLKLEGLIQERLSPIGESFYSLITPSHLHHLNCLSCGRVVSLEDCPLSETISQWSDAQQFKIFYHTIEFFGLCSVCQAEQQ